MARAVVRSVLRVERRRLGGDGHTQQQQRQQSSAAGLPEARRFV
jgi:hypothetical protein